MTRDLTADIQRRALAEQMYGKSNRGGYNPYNDPHGGGYYSDPYADNYANQQAQEQQQGGSDLGSQAGNTAGSLLGTGAYNYVTTGSVLGSAGGSAAASGAGAATGGAVSGGAAAGSGAASGATAGIGAAQGSMAGGQAGAQIASGAAGGTSSSLATAANYAWPLLAAYGIYAGVDNYRNAQDHGTGLTKEEAYLSGNPDIFGIHDSLPRDHVGYHLWGALLGSGKHEDQIHRDRVRRKMRGSGFITKNEHEEGPSTWDVRLADGSMFDIGRDGRSELDNGYMGYNVNWDDPTSHQTVGYLNPLLSILSGNNEKLTSDFVGYLTHAAQSNANGDPNIIRANARQFYQDMGLDKDTAYQAIDRMVSEGVIDEQMGHVYRNGVNELFDNREFYVGDNPHARNEQGIPEVQDATVEAPANHEQSPEVPGQATPDQLEVLGPSAAPQQPQLETLGPAPAPQAQDPALQTLGPSGISPEQAQAAQDAAKRKQLAALMAG